MEQLPGADSIFLSMETGDSHSHVGGLTILDPSGCPDFDYKRFASFVAERIRLAPRFGWKIREVPLGLDRPYWIEDPDYDPHRHIRRIAVPSPGGIHELAELAGFLFGQPLEKGRPLWEIWYIEGVEGGRVALFMKAHHCLMDGVSGAGLGELLCDLEPNPETPLAAAHRPELKKPGEPGELDMLLRGVRNWLGTPGRILDYGRRSAGRAVATLRALGEPEAPPLPFSAPKTIFNRNVGPKRAFACVTLPLDEIKAVRKHFDVTVNDVLLAVTGSAVRQYLIDRDELPEESLQVLVPVSTRSEDDDRLGNRVTNIAVSWASDVDDPAERLRRISRNAKKAKELLGAGDTFFLNALGELLPPALAGWMFRLGDADTTPLIGNVVVSNVRGTPIPLYTAGARIESMYPLSVLAVGQGLNITVVSYMGRVDFGFTVDPELVEDPWQLAEYVRSGLRELQALTERKESPNAGTLGGDVVAGDGVA
jgi:diacylglycerol O-acyltransferase